MPHPRMFDDDDPLLHRVRQIALALPDAAEKVSHGRPAFFTTKVFAYFGGSQRLGDGEWISHPHCIMVLPDPIERESLVQDPRCFVPAYLGAYGWVGFQLPAVRARRTQWSEVAELVDESYRNTAGRRRVAALDALRG